MINDRRPFRSCCALLALAAFLPACGSGGLVLPSDTAGTALFEQAELYAAEEKWRQASEAYDTLLRNYPTSPHLPEARLGLGRAYYERNRSDASILAIDAFRNFLTYHPSHPQVDYAQLMIALAYVQLMRAADRDQTHTREALRSFEEFFEDYPDSQYVGTAREQMQTVVDTLARHEWQVARFQLGRDRYAAARSRAHYALRNYAGTTLRCDLIFILAESHRREGDEGEARTYYRRIMDEHPDCEHAEDAARWIQ